MDETTAKIKTFIVEEFMPDVPVEDLEDEFDIGVDDSELGPDSFRTVAAIKEYVDQARSTANAE